MSDKKKTQDQSAAQTAKRKFKAKKNLTLPVMKLTLDTEYFVQITEPMVVGKKVDDKKEEAVIASVIDLDTGELQQLLVPSVMQGILHDHYGAPKYGSEKDENGVSHTVELAPGTHDYVNKIFSITKMPKSSGKAYHPMRIIEMEEE